MNPSSQIPPPLALVLAHLGDLGTAYLVGGALRDRLLGRATKDIDVVVPGQAAELARRIARATGSGFVFLDKERDIARVVLADGATLDLAAQVGPAIHDDLARRDFTINAMALPLAGAETWYALDPPPADTLIDPFHGMSDLTRGSIRMVAKSALEDDPLRLLRAPRLAAELAFAVEHQTAAAIRSLADGLAVPAAERIRDELLRTIAAAGAAGTARMYAALGLDTALARRLGLDVASADRPSVDRLRPDYSDPNRLPLDDLDALLSPSPTISTKVGGNPDLPPSLSPLVVRLHERQTMNVSHRIWLQLAGLLAQWQGGNPIASGAAILRHLAIAGRAATLVRSMWRAADEIASLAGQEQAQAHDVYRLLSRHGEGANGGILQALSQTGSKSQEPSPARRHQAITNLAPLVDAMWTSYFDPTTRLAPLLDGGELMSELGMGEGPEIGVLLAAVHEAQATGEIKTKDEAWQLVRSEMLHREHPSKPPASVVH